MRTFLRFLRQFLAYFFYPNPGGAAYTSRSMLVLLALCALLLLLSIGLRFWRTRLKNSMTRKLSKSWSSVSLCFGIAGVVLVVSRVEDIQFLAMRSVWLLWGVAAAVYLFFQWRIFRARHYEVLPAVVAVSDPRDSYLPGKKRKR
jgi:hypothetical protein